MCTSQLEPSAKVSKCRYKFLKLSELNIIRFKMFVVCFPLAHFLVSILPLESSCFFAREAEKISLCILSVFLETISNRGS